METDFHLNWADFPIELCSVGSGRGSSCRGFPACRNICRITFLVRQSAKGTSVPENSLANGKKKNAMNTRSAAASMLLAASFSLCQSAASPEVLKDLAPTGSCAPPYLGKAVLAQPDAGTGQAEGHYADLAMELGRRLGVPVDWSYQAGQGVFDAVKDGAWDVSWSRSSR